DRERLHPNATQRLVGCPGVPLDLGLPVRLRVTAGAPEGDSERSEGTEDGHHGHPDQDQIGGGQLMTSLDMDPVTQVVEVDPGLPRVDEVEAFTAEDRKSTRLN